MPASDQTVPQEATATDVAGWALFAFVALVPVHVISVDVGFELKPWFLPLIVAAVMSIRPAVKAALGLPRMIQIGVILMGVGGFLGMLNSADQARAFRHLIAVGIAVLVMLLIVTVRQIPYLGVAVRLGAIAMVSATVVEALLVMPRWVSIETMQNAGALIGELAEVAYGDIFLVTGAHGDSNFSALYGATWLFLLLAFPAERFFTRRADGAIVGLLVLQLVLSLSKTGLLSLIVAIIATAVMYWVVKGWRNVRPSIAAGLVAFLAVGGILLALDATDGHHDIAHGIRKRGGQVLIEADAAVALFTGDAVGPLDRAGIWRGYLDDFRENPLTGTGLGTPTRRPQYAHNAALEAAGGSGVLGLAGWLIVWLSVGWSLRALVLEHRQALALVGAVGVVFMASMFLSTNYEPIVALVFGIVLAPHLPTSVEPGGQ